MCTNKIDSGINVDEYFGYRTYIQNKYTYKQKFWHQPFNIDFNHFTRACIDSHAILYFRLPIFFRFHVLFYVSKFFLDFDIPSRNVNRTVFFFIAQPK